MSTIPAPKYDASCSLCHRADFRKCPCPWGDPFDAWPGALLDKLRRECPLSQEGQEWEDSRKR